MATRKKRGHDGGSAATPLQQEVWWACGYMESSVGKFRVRRIVSGRFLARAERRDGETIRKVMVTVTGQHG